MRVLLAIVSFLYALVAAYFIVQNSDHPKLNAPGASIGIALTLGIMVSNGLLHWNTAKAIRRGYRVGTFSRVLMITYAVGFATLSVFALWQLFSIWSFAVSVDSKMAYLGVAFYSGLLVNAQQLWAGWQAMRPQPQTTSSPDTSDKQPLSKPQSQEVTKMKLNEFAVSIPEGKETQDGYVHMTHATQYTIQLQNEGNDRCDAEVHIDAQLVGVWRVDAHSTIRIERPVHDTGRFTFYEVGTPEATRAGISGSSDTGLIRVVFKPEKHLKWEGVLYSSNRPVAGGTGLSGRSDQNFTSVATLEYDESRFVTIHLRLVSNVNEPRPLFPLSTPVPPPVGRRA